MPSGGSTDRIAKARLGALNRLGDGGQAVVFAAPGVRTAFTSSMVYKEYKPAVLAGIDVAALEDMPRFLERLPEVRGRELLARCAWPCRLVGEASRVTGFVMPAIPDEFFFKMRLPSGNVRKALGEFQHLLNPQAFLARAGIPLNDRLRYQLLAEVARSLMVFAANDVAVGDLSPKNLLFSLAPVPKVFFIDCDAMRLAGRSVTPQIETPDWEVVARHPREELATTASDSYKLALLALRLLVGDQQTRDPSRLPASTPGHIRRLLRETLARPPRTRPSAEIWLESLDKAWRGASVSMPVSVPAAVPVSPPGPVPVAGGRPPQLPVPPRVPARAKSAPAGLPAPVRLHAPVRRALFAPHTVPRRWHLYRGAHLLLVPVGVLLSILAGSHWLVGRASSARPWWQHWQRGWYSSAVLRGLSPSRITGLAATGWAAGVLIVLALTLAGYGHSVTHPQHAKPLALTRSIEAFGIAGAVVGVLAAVLYLPWLLLGVAFLSSRQPYLEAGAVLLGIAMSLIPAGLLWYGTLVAGRAASASAVPVINVCCRFGLRAGRWLRNRLASI